MGRIISANSVRTDALYYRNILLLHSINLQLMRSSVFSTLPSHPHREKRKNRDKMRSSIHPFIHSSLQCHAFNPPLCILLLHLLRFPFSISNVSHSNHRIPSRLHFLHFPSSDFIQNPPLALYFGF